MTLPLKFALAVALTAVAACAALYFFREQPIEAPPSKGEVMLAPTSSVEPSVGPPSSEVSRADVP
ncbi:MAG TPA: hypothetical protein VIV63_14360, partial [Steroidobacteraceae bacterium]